MSDPRMIGGFNTNVRYKGQTYHVQTEDGGDSSPTIVTLLYQGGAILFSKKHSYADQLGDETREGIVRQCMEDQHRTVLQALKSGRLDDRLGLDATDSGTAGTMGDDTSASAFGEGVISDRPLDEVVAAFLSR